MWAPRISPDSAGLTTRYVRRLAMARPIKIARNAKDVVWLGIRPSSEITERALSSNIVA
jgi:hypothetical protein